MEYICCCWISNAMAMLIMWTKHSQNTPSDNCFHINTESEHTKRILLVFFSFFCVRVYVHPSQYRMQTVLSFYLNCIAKRWILHYVQTNNRLSSFYWVIVDVCIFLKKTAAGQRQAKDPNYLFITKNRLPSTKKGSIT